MLSKLKHKKVSLYSAVLGSVLLMPLTSSAVDESVFVFDRFDQNRDATISYDEFYVHLLHSELFDIHAEFVAADNDEDNRISLKESDQFEVSESVFNQADTDGSRYVELSEFVQAYVAYLFAELDQNKNGFIDFGELSQLYKAS